MVVLKKQPQPDESADGQEPTGQAESPAEQQGVLAQQTAMRSEAATATDDGADKAGGPMPLVDELGVEDLGDILFAERGRLFSAAGRESPIAEIANNGVFLRPAQKPFEDEEAREVIIFGVDERGVVLNELGEPRRIIGAKYKGYPIFTLAEIKPGTVKHFAAWFDEHNKPHKMYVQGQALTSDMIFRIRNRTPDGEIAIFNEITTD